MGVAAEGRPKAALAAIGLMVAAGGLEIALALYFAGWQGNLFAGLLLFLTGGVYLYGGRLLSQGESSGWGAGMFGGILFFVFGLFLLPLAAITMALAAVAMVLLYLVRGYYGMVRYDPDEERRRKEALRTERMANPGRLHCHRCGSDKLWIAPDGSAWCESCKTGTISVKPPA